MQFTEEQRDRIADTLRLAEAIGGEAITVPAGDRGIADDVVGFAQANNVTQIIIGPGYEGTQDWHEKWRGVGETQMRQIYTTLTGRDEIWDRLDEI